MRFAVHGLTGMEILHFVQDVWTLKLSRTDEGAVIWSLVNVLESGTAARMTKSTVLRRWMPLGIEHFKVFDYIPYSWTSASEVANSRFLYLVLSDSNQCSQLLHLTTKTTWTLKSDNLTIPLMIFHSIELLKWTPKRCVVCLDTYLLIFKKILSMIHVLTSYVYSSVFLLNLVYLHHFSFGFFYFRFIEYLYQIMSSIW